MPYRYPPESPWPQAHRRNRKRDLPKDRNSITPHREADTSVTDAARQVRTMSPGCCPVGLPYRALWCRAEPSHARPRRAKPTPQRWAGHNTQSCSHSDNESHRDGSPQQRPDQKTRRPPFRASTCARTDQLSGPYPAPQAIRPGRRRRPGSRPGSIRCSLPDWRQRPRECRLPPPALPRFPPPDRGRSGGRPT